MPRTSKTALVLGGGNALGAYLAGAYEQLHRQDIRPDWIVGASGGGSHGGNRPGTGPCAELQRQDIRPDWIVGASVGAITGAILAGNAPEQRLEKLRQFWAEATQHTWDAVTGQEKMRQTYNGAHSLLT